MSVYATFRRGDYDFADAEALIRLVTFVFQTAGPSFFPVKGARRIKKEGYDLGTGAFFSSMTFRSVDNTISCFQDETAAERVFANSVQQSPLPSLIHALSPSAFCLVLVRLCVLNVVLHPPIINVLVSMKIVLRVAMLAPKKFSVPGLNASLDRKTPRVYAFAFLFNEHHLQCDCKYADDEGQKLHETRYGPASVASYPVFVDLLTESIVSYAYSVCSKPAFVHFGSDLDGSSDFYTSVSSVADEGLYGGIQTSSYTGIFTALISLHDCLSQGLRQNYVEGSYEVLKIFK
ncbi:hypothetical protein CVT25_005937 [Psilocybe cyanescens]|uniref:Uncharacterized protein n=1 Tax=Psilocybe cyanescens TaxID=93625 RepID=A0A409VSN9_PSICY|nr:hypothetical protein CVT25_005937 [Psilocybe cyanescens]